MKFFSYQGMINWERPREPQRGLSQERCAVNLFELIASGKERWEYLVLGNYSNSHPGCSVCVSLPQRFYLNYPEFEGFMTTLWPSRMLFMCSFDFRNVSDMVHFPHRGKRSVWTIKTVMVVAAVEVLVEYQS